MFYCGDMKRQKRRSYSLEKFTAGAGHRSQYSRMRGRFGRKGMIDEESEPWRVRARIPWQYHNCAEWPTRLAVK
jgi:hypothetical protein